MVREATPDDKLADLVKDGPTVISVNAPWCGPCHKMAPIFEKLSHEYKDINFVKLDSEDCGDICVQLGFKSLPAFFFFKDGEKVYDLFSADPAQLEAKLKDLQH